MPLVAIFGVNIAVVALRVPADAAPCVTQPATSGNKQSPSQQPAAASSSAVRASCKATR